MPDVIYKYEPFTELSLRNLKNSSVYFNSPFEFNDPYDCAVNTILQEPTIDEITRFREFSKTDDDMPPEEKEIVQGLDDKQLKHLMFEAAKKVLEEGINTHLYDKGVACFSRNNSNLLMWSHYSVYSPQSYGQKRSHLASY